MVVLDEQEHPVFKRKGSDLLMELVSTMSSQVSMSIGCEMVLSAINTMHLHFMAFISGFSADSCIDR